VTLNVIDVVVDEGGVAMACVVLISSPEAIQREVTVTLFTTGGSATCESSYISVLGNGHRSGASLDRERVHT
jgi:hypothetical protein